MLIGLFSQNILSGHFGPEIGSRTFIPLLEALRTATEAKLISTATKCVASVVAWSEKGQNQQIFTGATLKVSFNITKQVNISPIYFMVIQMCGKFELPT